MKVYLAAAVTFDHALTAIPEFTALAERDRFGVHTLTDDPTTADVILFVDAHQHPNDWRLESIRRHPLAARCPDKVCLYDERDRPWCALPGIYVSMPKSAFNPRRQRACAYHRTMNQFVTPTNITPDLLFSFMGGKSHKLREGIFRLSHSRAEITNTSHVNFFSPSGEADYAERIEQQKQSFANTLLRSKFVLCPRGAGTSSIRLYEVMSAGRAPVIISDEWERPVGPDWEKCAITISEADIEKIPHILEQREQEAEAIGAQALAAYAEWFAPDVTFHRLIENCRELLQNPPSPRSGFDRQYLRCGWEDAAIRGRMSLVKLRNRLRGSG